MVHQFWTFSFGSKEGERREPSLGLLKNQMGMRMQARGKEEQRRRERGTCLILIDFNNREIISLGSLLVMSERVNVTVLLYGTQGRAQEEEEWKRRVTSSLGGYIGRERLS